MEDSVVQYLLVRLAILACVYILTVISPRWYIVIHEETGATLKIVCYPFGGLIETGNAQHQCDEPKCWQAIQTLNTGNCNNNPELAPVAHQLEYAIEVNEWTEMFIWVGVLTQMILLTLGAHDYTLATELCQYVIYVTIFVSIAYIISIDNIQIYGDYDDNGHRHSDVVIGIGVYAMASMPIAIGIYDAVMLSSTVLNKEQSSKVGV